VSWNTIVSAADRFSGFISAHSALLLTIVPFAAAGIGAFLMQMKCAGTRPSWLAVVKYLFPPPHWFSRSMIIDVALYLFHRFLWSGFMLWCLTVGIFCFSSIFSTILFFTINSEHNIQHDAKSIILVCLAMFVCLDLGMFLSHYSQHKMPVLWEFHKVHHSATFLTPFTAHRAHPVGLFVDSLFSSIFVSVPIAIAEFRYDFSIRQLLMMSAATSLSGNFFLSSVLQHSHFPISFGVLERVFISPLMHQAHHSLRREHWDKNFGSKLSIWDWIFGTAVVVRSDEKLLFGLATSEAGGGYQTVWGCYFGSLIRAYRVVAGNEIMKYSPLTPRSENWREG
jgi:sterol desaturase/sphingolipid hydroxylase (fatty acid hydroxylase superfamily)